jgi:hypothetical protein
MLCAREKNRLKKQEEEKAPPGKTNARETGRESKKKGDRQSRPHQTQPFPGPKRMEEVIKGKVRKGNLNFGRRALKVRCFRRFENRWDC